MIDPIDATAVQHFGSLSDLKARSVEEAEQELRTVLVEAIEYLLELESRSSSSLTAAVQSKIEASVEDVKEYIFSTNRRLQMETAVDMCPAARLLSNDRKLHHFDAKYEIS